MRGLKQRWRLKIASRRVASFTDAWIETREGLLKISSFRSHLLQMRGLKRNQPYKHYRPRQVASFTDAWIETYQSAGVFSQCQSHLLQMRGLKRPF